MRTYFQNGTMKEGFNYIDENGEFLIQELETETLDKFAYPGDSINYTLDDELCKLYDTLRDMFFEDTEKYYQELEMLPIWVKEAGQNSDCTISADTFNEWTNGSSILNLYKHLYLVDCQFLVGTVQNLLCAMEDAFIRFYKIIAFSGRKEKYQEYERLTNPNGTIYEISQSSTRASAMIEMYFTKAYSILDIVCKICYEIQYKQEDFSTYRKARSADVLWGNRKKLMINGTSNTLFERCELISKIEALRNELVHNGTWIDFESEISNVIQAIDKDMHGLSKVYKLEDEFERLSNGFLNRKFYESQMAFKDLRDRLLSDLNKLIRAFEIYLCEYVEKIEVERRSPDIESLEEIGYILSFNYTDTYRNIYDVKDEIEYDYFHGKAKIENTVETNNMVLGIDEYLSDTMRNENTDFIAFKKFYQRIYKDCEELAVNWCADIRKEFEYSAYSRKFMIEDQISFELVSKESDNLYRWEQFEKQD